MHPRGDASPLSRLRVHIKVEELVRLRFRIVPDLVCGINLGGGVRGGQGMQSCLD